ncbi:MAG TPA: fructose-1,6-bisphosphate aldolase/phosphatase [Gammaproteobacteria bacterium]|nr:fructose-1,6-bisphosphate aldolase/phosphatase [Gammaproteobacteria bacterium]
MKLTLSVIKADVGSIGGHICPSKRLLEAVRAHLTMPNGGKIIDSYVSATGDDIAILVTHRLGVGNPDLHHMAWDAFVAGTRMAKSQGLYGAGQDLLKDAFSGNVRGAGPAVAEMEIEERDSESFVFFAADKTDPGAFNFPLYLAFADPMNTPGLLLSPNLAKGFRFVIMDVTHTGNDRVIELNAPEDLYDLAALLRGTEQYVIESIWSRASGQQTVAASTSRLHNIAGKYTGKDDPVMLVRVQMDFPATGEVLAPYATGAFVAGGMRGSHNMPLMPVPLGSGISYFDGPPIITGAAFSVHQGKLTEPVDVFAHPFWDEVRSRVAGKAMDMRRQGFFGAAMLPMDELEYTGITTVLKRLDARFSVRKDQEASPKKLVSVKKA